MERERDMLPWWLVMVCNCAASASARLLFRSVIETWLYVYELNYTNLTSLQGSTLNYGIQYKTHWETLCIRNAELPVSDMYGTTTIYGQRAIVRRMHLCSRARGVRLRLCDDGDGMLRNIEGIAHIIQYLRFSNPVLPFNLFVYSYVYECLCLCCYIRVYVHILYSRNIQSLLDFVPINIHICTEQSLDRLWQNEINILVDA